MSRSIRAARTGSCLLAALLAAGCVPLTREVEARADVVVYGATPGGVCAAIAAAREGADVVLLEPTEHIGGLTTGGLSHCDSNQMVRSTLMGLFDEWHTRVVADYVLRGLPAPYDPANKDQARWTFEPHVAMRVTRAMLAEAGVRVRTSAGLRSVQKLGPRVTAVATRAGAFAARVFVDGTYEGDLMAAAGVDWTIGREGRDAYGESLAGKQFPKRRMDIDGFDGDGGLLPLVTTRAGGDETAGDDHVMTYSFRLCLTADPANRVPMPAPERYDPKRFEVVRRALRAGVAGVGFDLYPLPGGKFDGNNSIGGQFSLGLVGGGDRWHAADEDGRRVIWEEHKQYTLELFRFLTTDPAVPAATRERFAELGLCRDEFAAYDHFSPALYVRESRRMQGLYVLSQRDILQQPSKPDPIAVSSFPIDSHDCQRIAHAGGGVVNEGTIFPVRTKAGYGYAYHVPYRALLPRPQQCDNLLVPVALSCTHVGISSLRIEGAWMTIGQAAGVAAALAVAGDVAVQQLDYASLRARLLAQGQVLELPPASGRPAVDEGAGILLDDADAELSGSWSLSTRFPGFIGAGYRHTPARQAAARGDGSATATFRFRAPASGRYLVLMAYSSHSSRAQRVPVTVTSGRLFTRLAVDQTAPLPAGRAFRRVGVAALEAGVETVLEVSDAGTEGFVILDALQLVPEPAADPRADRVASRRR